MHTVIKLLTCLLIVNTIFAYDGNHPPNTYRSSSNPYYWKNKIPDAGYWQQDVYYQVEATIDEQTDIIHGEKYQLTYWNNSPDTLTHLYFHLFQNAFQPHSYMHSLYENNDQKIDFGKYEAQGLGTVTKNIKVNGQAVDTLLDNTILKIILNKPLLPHDSLVVEMNFDTYYDTGDLRRRMKTFKSSGGKHYDGVHWYPSICVYDRKFGWTTEQHMDKEFYHNFGTFDMKLTFREDYVVEATGTLQNKAEVLPKDYRRSIDLFEYIDHKDSLPVFSFDTTKTKTWHFYAENVHNFAFTADPDYLLGEKEWNGIKVVAAVQKPHAAGWEKTLDFTAKVVQIYSEDFGMYAWPKIIVADAQDGMEYPMLTLDGGTYPGHQGLIAHEVGHMWFYGMIGSNETYRAFMDEGFTQFLTVWSMDRITGRKRTYTKDNFYYNHKDPLITRYYRLYYGYLKYARNGYDHPLNTHSSMFEGAVRHGGGYGLVYYKTGVMLYNLKYVLGDTLFQNAMKYYFNIWKMAHPYPEDFRQSIIDYTKVDLNWFFDQWLETTKQIDYSIKSVKKSDNNTYKITFERKGRMHMPIDFTVTAKSGKKHQFYIPNTWFEKETSAEILPKWYGWDNIKPTYTATITLSEEIEQVEIDPDNFLADIDLSNNKWKNNYTWEFDHHVPNMDNWYTGRNYWRPDMWYNGYDGLQIGLHANGNYFNEKHIYTLSAWYNTGAGQQNIPESLKNDHSPFAFHASLRENLSDTWRNLWFEGYYKFNAGLHKYGLTLEKTFRKQDMRNPEHTKIYSNFDFMYRARQEDRQYLIYRDLWGISQNNFTLNLGVERQYKYKIGVGRLSFDVRTPGVFSDYNYSYLELSAINDNRLGKIDIKTRYYGRLGTGNTPYESALYVSGANPEELYNNKYTRAQGFVPQEWSNYSFDNANHFQQGGGLNLRGYAGHLLLDDSTISYVGKSGTSASIELEFQNLLRIKPSKLTKNFHLDMYLFADAGILAYTNNQNNQQFGKLRADAGIGSSLTTKFGRYSIHPLTIRFDVPVYVSDPAATEDVFDWRYVIGINRSF